MRAALCLGLVLLLVGAAGCSDDGDTADAALSDAKITSDGPAGESPAADGPIAGDAAATSPWVKVNGATDCPHVDLGSSVPVSYVGSTAGLPNLVESTRLEWTDAPDDSLIFSAPEDGDYVIYLTSDAQKDGVGASAKDYGGALYAAATCPAAGSVTQLDGVYTQNDPSYPLQLTAGQRLVIWVSAASWEPQKTPSYTLRIEKQ